MHTRVSLLWDNDDPFPMGKRIEEAFNRVINFCPELQCGADKKASSSSESKAFNRVVVGEFSVDDLTALVLYSATITNRISESVRPENPLAESIAQAGKNLVDTLKDTVAYVHQCLRPK